MAKSYIGRNETEKAFIKIFQSLTSRHNPWTVWQDFINVSACAMANAVDKTPEIYMRREESYRATVKKYTTEEVNSLSELFGLTIAALEENPAQDFLGNLYMNLDFGSSWSGQFFTPWHISEMMARMMIGDTLQADLEKKGWASICDPCCGAGCMLMAFAQACRQELKINYQPQILFVGQDIDRVVAQMCYLQVSLLGCAGYIVVGNTLSQPIRGELLTLVVDTECEVWYTPMWFSDTWTYRRTFTQLSMLFGESAQQNQ